MCEVFNPFHSFSPEEPELLLSSLSVSMLLPELAESDEASESQEEEDVERDRLPVSLWAGRRRVFYLCTVS